MNIEKQFKAWAVQQPNRKGTKYKESTINTYCYALNTSLPLFEFIDYPQKSYFEITDIEEITKLYELCRNHPKFEAINNKDQNHALNPAIKLYIKFLITDEDIYYIEDEIITNDIISSIDIYSVIKAIDKYHNDSLGYCTRYNSWRYCYNAFKKNRHKENNSEYLCLHLANFMSSWGMLRNSGLLNYDFYVHKPFIEAICNSKYDSLYLDNFSDIDLIIELKDIINNTYPNDISKTDTFITKILLGVFGVTPAFDRYFIKSIRQYNITSGIFNKKSISKLYSFYELYREELESLRYKYLNDGYYYTKMKMIDMAFWQIGIDMEKEKGQ